MQDPVDVMEEPADIVEQRGEQDRPSGPPGLLVERLNVIAVRRA